MCTNSLKLALLTKLLIKHVICLLHPQVVIISEKYEFTTGWDVGEILVTRMIHCILQLQQWHLSTFQWHPTSMLVAHYELCIIHIIWPAANTVNTLLLLVFFSLPGISKCSQVRHSFVCHASCSITFIPYQSVFQNFVCLIITANNKIIDNF